MASIDKRGDGFRVRWRDPDGQARSRQCPTLRSAKELAREVEEAVALGRRWAPPAEVRIPELAELIDAFLRDMGRVARQLTIDNYHAKLGTFLAFAASKARTRAVPVTVLSRTLLEDFDADRIANGYKASSRRAVLGMVMRFWRWGAQHDEWRAHVPNPSAPAMPAVSFEAVQAAEWREVDEVLRTATERAARSPGREWVRRLIWLMRCLGWRVSQCYRLQWTDVDLERGTMRLRPELGKSRNERRGRTVPLPPVLRAEIETWGRREGFLIGKTINVATHATANVRDCWVKATLDGKPMRAEVFAWRPDHAFRKTFRTELVRARCSSDAIEYWCGRSTGIGGDVYTDPRALDLMEIANAIPAPTWAATSSVPGVSRDKVADLDRARYRRAL